MRINMNKLRQWLDNSRIYQRGIAYYKEGRVETLDVDFPSGEKNLVNVWAVVGGTEDYDVYLSIDSRGNLRDQTCTCLAYEGSRHGMCKHIVAVALEFNDRAPDFQCHEKNWNSHEISAIKEEIPMLSHEEKMDQKSEKNWDPEQVADFNATDTAGNSQGQTGAFAKNQEDQKVTDKKIYALMQEALREDLHSLQETAGEIHLQPLLHLRHGDLARLELKVGSKRMYVVPSIKKLLSAVKKNRMESYGKNLKFSHGMENFDEKSQKLLCILQKEFLEQFAIKQTEGYAFWGQDPYYSAGWGGIDRKIPLSAAALDELMSLYQEEGIEVLASMPGKEAMLLGDPTREKILEGFPPLEFLIQKDETGNFIFSCEEPLFLIGATGRDAYYWLYQGGIYRCPLGAMKKVESLIEILSQTPGRRLRIDRRDMRTFLALAVEELEKFVTIKMDPGDREEYAPYTLDSGIYLDVGEDGEVQGKVTFLYGEHLVNPMEAADQMGVRNLKQEIPIMRVISGYLPVFDEEKSVFKAEGDEKILTLLEEGIQALEEVTVVYGTEAFRRLILHQPPRPSIRVSVGLGVLDMELSLGGFSLLELMDALQAYKMGKKYIRLSSGSFLKLDSEEMEELNQLTQDLDLEDRPKGKKGEGEEGYHLKLPLPRALFLRESLKTCKHLDLEESEEFRQLTRAIASAQNSTATIPKQVESILRHYQKEGLQWLYALSRCGMGGILADDMGLGKTLQIIALLLHYYEENSGEKPKPSLVEGEEHATASPLAQLENLKPSLVVCPTSLVLNWEQEIQKFAPQLKTLLIIGKASERQEKISCAKDYQVVITSYDSMRRDAIYYEDTAFAFHILDEAQYIKNQFTQNARSVKGIQSDHRFALSGTPMENYICELWSIFDFLMPGYLHSHRKFQEKFENPIEKKKDGQALEKLRKLVSPFILRRMKKEVLGELPEKTETTHYVEMEEEQSKIYKSNAALLHKQLRAQLEEQGLAKSKILVLSMITRLRQICCHPSLCFEDYTAGSAKLEAALELMDNAVENGHKLLVFSQFTSMLALLEEELKRRKMAYYLLTGSTPIGKRSQMVNDFNRDDTPVFLISLKAGGTGLNLTGADIVLHLDPWWNVSAQNQATDRAHRIGQSNKVQVYKLIAKDTIEEKIQQLQAHKANLAEALLEGEGPSFTDMNAEDLLALFRE